MSKTWGRTDPYCDETTHDWQPDPDRKGEGLCCTLCGVTEAELDAMKR